MSQTHTIALSTAQEVVGRRRIGHTVMEYHTHPTGCGADSLVCGYAFPSRRDLRTILRRGRKHAVVSREGTFVVTPFQNAQLAHPLQLSPALVADLDQIRAKQRQRVPSHRLRAGWMRAVNRSGQFRVRLLRSPRM